jgi:hypothetical protein
VRRQTIGACGTAVLLAAAILSGCAAAPGPAGTQVVRATPQVDGPWAAAGQSFPGSACGSDPVKDVSTLTPGDAELAQEISRQVGALGVPFRNARWKAVANDGTFAQVLVCLQMRQSVADTWQEYVAETQLAKVAGHWRSDASVRPEPLDAWRKREASTTAAGKIHAEVVRVEARDRPKEVFAIPGKSYVASVRWSTDDHARHVVRYMLWVLVDGHTCLPSSSFAPSTTPPKDVEQRMYLSMPLAADGTGDFKAPDGEITVGVDPVEKAYSIGPAAAKEDVQCASIDNPHGQQLRITAVDGTYLSSPLDTPATPPSIPSR